jgi:chaperonin GroES
MITPLYDRIIVKRTEAEEITEGGIIIPDDSREKPCEGTVVAVGKGRLGDSGNIIPLEVVEGDKVLFSVYSGVEMLHEGEELLIMREDELLAVMED